MEVCLNFASEVRRDWHEGRKYCESLGAELACLDYEDLHLQVIDELYRTQGEYFLILIPTLVIVAVITLGVTSSIFFQVVVLSTPTTPSYTPNVLL